MTSDTEQAASPQPRKRSSAIERAAQILVLLLGGGIGGILTTVLSNAIEWRKLSQQAEINNASFVDKYLTFVIDKDIHTRVRIAEYFSFVLESSDGRERWKSYLANLEQKESALTAEYIAEFLKVNDDTLPVRQKMEA